LVSKVSLGGIAVALPDAQLMEQWRKQTRLTGDIR
jgi:hypothetical protein